MGVSLLMSIFLAGSGNAQGTFTAAEARAIAKEAYVYGFPMVDSYRINYAYFVDSTSPEFKKPWNQINNTARLYTPDDKAVQTPNSDTPYSQLGMDLRREPLVLTVPAIEKGRYFSVQLIDAYTFNFAYIGSRSTGNDGGSFLIAGPSWAGEKPQGVTEVIRSETEFSWALFRTQLLNTTDLANVQKIQEGYKVQPLSAFLGTTPPAAVAEVSFIKPLAPDAQRTSPEFFNVLNFILQFCPPHSSETDLRARFAKIGIEPGASFDAASLEEPIQEAIKLGMADAWAEFTRFKTTQIDNRKVVSGDLFGTRAYLKNNYLYRMAAAILGIYGNSKEEAMYPFYGVDGEGKPLDGNSRYSVRFAPGHFPPVNAFWSLTMYKLPESLLYANSLDRYLINSSMLPGLKLDADGGVTLLIQNQNPGKELESNWLPAPEGPFYMAMRLYWPKAEALDGTWTAPPAQKIN
jgi:hypothetical protein